MPSVFIMTCNRIIHVAVSDRRFMFGYTIFEFCLVCPIYIIPHGQHIDHMGCVAINEPLYFIFLTILRVIKYLCGTGIGTMCASPTRVVTA